MSSIFQDIEELRVLVEQLETWVSMHRERGNPDRADRLQLYLDALNKIDNHQQAQAAVWAIKAMFHAMIEDADRGLDVRHIRKPLPGKAPIEQVKKLWQELHEREPGIKTDSTVTVIADNLGCAKSTVYQRLKEAGITGRE